MAGLLLISHVSLFLCEKKRLAVTDSATKGQANS
jgi:hypothetical protein